MIRTCVISVLFGILTVWVGAQFELRISNPILYNHPYLAWLFNTSHAVAFLILVVASRLLISISGRYLPGKNGRKPMMLPQILMLISFSLWRILQSALFYGPRQTLLLHLGLLSESSCLIMNMAFSLYAAGFMLAIIVLLQKPEYQRYYHLILMSLFAVFLALIVRMASIHFSNMPLAIFESVLLLAPLTVWMLNLPCRQRFWCR